MLYHNIKNHRKKEYNIYLILKIVKYKPYNNLQISAVFFDC